MQRPDLNVSKTDQKELNDCREKVLHVYREKARKFPADSSRQKEKREESSAPWVTRGGP